MSAVTNTTQVKAVVAKITSKGQITIPAETRRLLGLKPGDKVSFEPSPKGDVLIRKAEAFPFNRFKGMGTGVPELEAGPDSILQYLREFRGHDEFDHLD
jgi:AbrB family looped-hinge helix DNA binding protein